MVLGDSHGSRFVDRRERGEGFLDLPIFAVQELNARDWCRPLVAVVVEPTVYELATVDESDHDRRRGMQALVIEFLFSQGGRFLPSSLSIGFVMVFSPLFNAPAWRKVVGRQS